MASKSIDWDSVLVTQDPKKKEVVVSFPADGYGSFAGPSDTDWEDAPECIIDENIDSVKLFEYPAPNIIYSSDRLESAILWQYPIDSFLALGVRGVKVPVRAKNRAPVDRKYTIRAVVGTDSGLPDDTGQPVWPEEYLPAPAEVTIPAGELDGVGYLLLPENVNPGQDPIQRRDMFINATQGAYYVFDVVLDVPYNCQYENSFEVLAFPCDSDQSLVFVVPYESSPLRHKVSFQNRDCPPDPPPPEYEEPIIPENPLPECADHSCDAIKDIAFTGNVGGYYEGLTIPANPATGEIYDQFGGATGLIVVNGGPGYDPTFTDRFVNYARSLSARASGAGACYNFRALDLSAENVISRDFPIDRQVVTSYSSGGSVVPIRVERINSGTVILKPAEITFFSYINTAYSDGSHYRLAGSIRISDVTDTSVSYTEYSTNGGSNTVTVSCPPSTPGVPDIWSFKIDYTFSAVNASYLGFPEDYGIAAKLSGKGTILKNGVVVASGFRAMSKSGYKPEDFETYLLLVDKTPIGIIKERYQTSPYIYGSTSGFYNDCAIFIDVGNADKASLSDAALKARQAFSGYQAPSYCEILQ